MTAADPWWRRAVVYQIYPRSFADSNGDGVGDLPGVEAHLDHLVALGVDAVWLSPFYRSPMRDAGYDVSDHCDVDPVFGTLDDARRLLERCRVAGLRVLVDYVPNHTSDRHPWFVESRSSRASAKRDWYLWRDRPNNWLAAIERVSAWSLDAASGQCYLHLFLASQPDLNWRNPEVVAAMHDVARFWLDLGVSGFRVDAVQCLGKDPTFADDPRCALGLSLAQVNDQPYTHEVLRGLRAVVDGYGGDRVLVGEVDLPSPAAVAAYLGRPDGLHLAFDFEPTRAGWDPVPFREAVARAAASNDGEGAWPTWVLSNHDLPHERTRYGGSERRARAAAVAVLCLRGTPFLYQGQELGLEDAVVPPTRRIDPDGRDGCRAPLPWLAEAPYGWAGATPWLPWPPEPGRHNAAVEGADPSSTLSLFRRLLALRRRSPALQVGLVEPLPVAGDLLAYLRRHHAGGPVADERIVVVNFADAPREVTLPAPRGVTVPVTWTIDVDSSSPARRGAPFVGEVPGETALVLRPGGGLSTAGGR